MFRPPTPRRGAAKAFRLRELNDGIADGGLFTSEPSLNLSWVSEAFCVVFRPGEGSRSSFKLVKRVVLCANFFGSCWSSYRFSCFFEIFTFYDYGSTW